MMDEIILDKYCQKYKNRECTLSWFVLNLGACYQYKIDDFYKAIQNKHLNILKEVIESIFLENIDKILKDKNEV